MHWFANPGTNPRFIARLLEQHPVGFWIDWISDTRSQPCWFKEPFHVIISPHNEMCNTHQRFGNETGAAHVIWDITQIDLSLPVCTTSVTQTDKQMMSNYSSQQ